MKKIIPYFLAGAILLACFVLGEWVFASSNPTFHHHFLYHPEVPNLWRTLNTLPYIVGMITSGNVHQPSSIGYYAAAAVQWFILGVVLWALAMKLKTKKI